MRDEKIALDLLQKLDNRFKATGRGLKPIFYNILRENFFKAPASTKYHLNHEGGLLEHSLNVYFIFQETVEKYDLNISKDSIILCGLFHDICKHDMYLKTEFGYKYNKKVKGHGTRSVKILSRFFDLTNQEKKIIKYHMALFGSELSYIEEYSTEELYEAIKEEPLVQIFAACDMIATQMEE